MSGASVSESENSIGVDCCQRNAASNVGLGTASPNEKLEVAGNLAVRKGDKLLLDADDATRDTYLIRNAGATTVSWFVDGVELAMLKKQTEVR
jgi:hypothetical protein